MSASPPLSPSARVHRAIGLMVAGTVLFALMAVCIRLAASELHAFQIAFFRVFFGLAFLLPMLVRHGPGILRTDRLRFYVFRCAIGMVSMFAGFWAIVHLPLAQAIAISYSTPLFVTIGAVFFLGEVVGARRWTAVVIGFLGVLVIMRPGAESFTAGSLVALLAALASANAAISIKFLSRTEHPDAIVLWTTLIWVPMALGPALLFWRMPTGLTWLWIVLSGALGTTAHLLWTRALRLGDASMLTPISFLQILVVAVFGWWLFDEPLDRWTALGAAIIFASNLYIARREARLARAAVTDPDISGDAPTPR